MVFTPFIFPNMSKTHVFKTNISWQGSPNGTISYKSYSRNHTISVENKPTIPASSDVTFRGDATRYNPEELMIASVSSCHMLWYLHLCADAGVIVLDYNDAASGKMLEEEDGSGRFTEIMLNPMVTVQDASMLVKANELHQQAHQLCFIANSCNFPIKHSPLILAEEKQ